MTDPITDTADAEEFIDEFVDAELDGVEEGSLQVESATAKITLNKSDRSLFELHRQFTKGRLVIDPDWQREYVWDRKRASRLIESFLIDIPVPVIYLAVNKEGSFEVIDGLQRLTSCFNFFDDKFSLIGLEILPSLNGKRFKSLPTDLQSKLESTTIRTFELAETTPQDLMFLIFERLNTGGIRLNEMEIRNCLYRGKLNDLVKRLAHSEDFVACLNQKNVSKRMNDRLLVLRFLAFYERTHQKAKSGLKKFINEFFQSYRNPAEEKLKEYEKQYSKAMKASLTVFGQNAFRLRREKANGGGEWASKPNAAIFQAVTTSFTEYDLSQITRRADAIYEEYVDLVTEDDRWVNSVKASTGDYNQISYVFETWRDRLKKAIGDEKANDAKRCFTRQLKEEMFKQSDTCELCGNKIVLLMDAVLDHDKHYWRGGKTVPENARLVHRLCNQKRPK